MTLVTFNSPYRYVLEGRIVTMGSQGVIADGAIYIEDGIIIDVKPTDAPAPPNFSQSEHIRTGDTLYPGLIELHNHLPYNAIPLWPLTRSFSNNGQWRSNQNTNYEYARNVQRPAQILGKTAGLVEAVIRFVECRCLLGGTTTSQGITLVNVGTTDLFPGLVRNVEKPDIDGLKGVGTRIDNPPTDQGDKDAYLTRLQNETCFLQHLSEGVDDTARGWFLRLKMDDGSWAIDKSLCGIHSSALKPEDFDVLVQHGASMVWSPLSNFLLYGGTADIQAVANSGIKVGLGSDWGPSGSKNLLGELKVAWLTSQEAGGVFSDQRLVQMATIDAAEILGWDQHLGSLEAGKRADIIAINGKTGDPYLHLIEARETSLTLVVIDGIPRIGQPRIMNRFALPNPETFMVGSSRRILHLAQSNVHPLVAGLTLNQAINRLGDALKNLPTLAPQIGSALLQGLAAGDAGSPLSAIQLDLDLDEESVTSTAMGLMGDDVFPMELEGITVPNDPNFLAKLVASPNLPAFIYNQLPGLYGESVPEPFVASTDQFSIRGLPARINATVQSMDEFLKSKAVLTKSDRQRLVSQALLILSQNYAHLPFKRSMHGIDPIQQLRLLQYQVDQSAEDNLEPDINFHNNLTTIFQSLRDLHTTYRLPYPYSGIVAWLPFFVEEYWGEGRNHYLISKVVQVSGLELPDDLLGAELLYWNGTTIANAIEINADRQAGSNLDARHVRGLNSLTLRPLGRGLPPTEESVTIQYLPDGGEKPKELRLSWFVFMPQAGFEGQSVKSIDNLHDSALGIDDHTNDIQEAKLILFSKSEVKEKARFSTTMQPERIKNAVDAIPTQMPTIMRAKIVDTDVGKIGHLRIFSFNVAVAEAFIFEMGRLLRQLPKRGVILDIRGNGGGLILAAEGALRLLTPQQIAPQRAQFINTPLNLKLCERNPDDRADGARLSHWTPSIRKSVQTGSIYSSGFPITDPAWLNQIEQQYDGPVGLITDALCYSSSDIFAAGFQDHGIGPIIGVHGNTGAGGANVWSYQLLQKLATLNGESLLEYLPLPDGADFHVAIRRTVRVGLNAGDILEDLGVIPNRIHPMTKVDLLEDNQELLNTAAQTLFDWQAQRPTVQQPNQSGDINITVPEGSTADFTLNIHTQPFQGAQTGTHSFNLADVLAQSDKQRITLAMEIRNAKGETFTHYVNLKPNKNMEDNS